MGRPDAFVILTSPKVRQRCTQIMIWSLLLLECVSPDTGVEGTARCSQRLIISLGRKFRGIPSALGWNCVHAWRMLLTSFPLVPLRQRSARKVRCSVTKDP